MVLATPTATNDTKEHIDFPGFAGEHVIGVETRFIVSAVLKGDKALRGRGRRGCQLIGRRGHRVAGRDQHRRVQRFHDFLAASVGTTSITASAGGYGSWTVSVTVQNNTFMLFSDGSTSIGQFLETTGAVYLIPNPAVGLQVTLQSNSRPAAACDQQQWSRLQ